ncbi:ABC family iron transporter Atm1 [Schizosaccharomyces japonicus yFS275]|uniref:Iron-sulfur clusters transporter ATM1, mitochondrial n=1 Tax=Schizosaccharomyces japonicus (strain yFS275 / FY16936) TaxID=402676 RepID=B6K2I6_SCHJY|nr:ABC family iron transporter Atm1 [Schizosaccharomyces japonicus yFS275]EEB07367.2 ABC family iron transporter Atm1 [Schizosaccharomyces japonicus yFS275]
MRLVSSRLLLPCKRAGFAYQGPCRTLWSGYGNRLSPNKLLLSIQLSRFHSNAPKTKKQDPEQSTTKTTTKSKKSSVVPEGLGSLAPEKQSEWGIVKNMMQYVWPKNQRGIKIRVVSALVLLLGAKVFNVQVPFYFKSIVDTMDKAVVGQLGPVWSTAGAVVLGYGLARVFSTVFQEIRNSVFATVSQNAIRNVSRNIFDHLLRLDMNFHLKKQTGQVTRAMDRGTKGISFVLSSMVLHIIPITLEIGMVCSILTYKYGAPFALLTALTMGTYSVFTIKTTSWRTRFRRQANQADNEAATVAIDSLINVEAVKAFNNEGFESQRFNKHLSAYEKASIRVASSLAFLNSGQNIIFSTALTAMISSSSCPFSAELPRGSVYREMRPVRSTDMENLFSAHACKRRHPRGAGGAAVEAARRRDSLRKRELQLPQVAAHLARLHLYHPSRLEDGGRILIDGQEVKRMRLSTLRRAIGIVPQDTPLFNDTIGANIGYGRPSATQEEVIDAARRARIDHIIQRFPDGYETMVGERGLMLSGGEKQRIAISRLLLKNPEICFFDEATSALDTTTERDLLNNINWLLQESRKTSIFIAHRLRTILDCDLIFVMKDGRVAEQGTHAELLARGGIYREMWEAQADQDGEQGKRQATA